MVFCFSFPNVAFRPGETTLPPVSCLSPSAPHLLHLTFCTYANFTARRKSNLHPLQSLTMLTPEGGPEQNGKVGYSLSTLTVKGISSMSMAERCLPSATDTPP